MIYNLIFKELIILRQDYSLSSVSYFLSLDFIFLLLGILSLYWKPLTYSRNRKKNMSANRRWLPIRIPRNKDEITFAPLQSNVS